MQPEPTLIIWKLKGSAPRELHVPAESAPNGHGFHRHAPMDSQNRDPLFMCGRINRPPPHCGVVRVHSTGSSIRISQPRGRTPPLFQTWVSPQTPDQEHTPPTHRPRMRTPERSFFLDGRKEQSVPQKREMVTQQTTKTRTRACHYRGSCPSNSAKDGGSPSEGSTREEAKAREHAVDNILVQRRSHTSAIGNRM